LKEMFDDCRPVGDEWLANKVDSPILGDTNIRHSVQPSARLVYATTIPTPFSQTASAHECTPY
jgi:hypothetical protein